MFGRKRLRELEARIDKLERRLNRETNYFPESWFFAPRLSLREVVRAMAEHINIDFKFVSSRPSRYECVEKIEDDSD